jgi:hypothetical protein
MHGLYRYQDVDEYGDDARELADTIPHEYTWAVSDTELPQISDELKRELMERLRAHKASPESSEPWESVEREVFGPIEEESELGPPP